MDLGSQVGGRLEASWLEKSMASQSKKSWAFPHRSGDVPGASRARIIGFALVFEGLGVGESKGAPRPGVDSPTP